VTPDIRKSLGQQLFPVVAGVVAFWLAILPAGAIIGTSFQMQLGNPSNATADPNNHTHYLIQRTVEALDYNDILGEPNWASWDLTASDVGSSGRSSSFFTDTNLPPGFYEVTTSDYTGSGFDRGHMCPSADRTDNVTDNDMVFFMSNIIPQAPINNQGVWADFETYCRTLAQSGDELLITCGPSGFDGSYITSGKAAIGSNVWKIAVVVPPGGGGAPSRITASTRVITLKIPNTASATSSWQSYVTSAHQVELETGFNFFSALPPTIASALRSKVDGQTNPPPFIASFSPASGNVNSTIIVTGGNFSSAMVVSFNGMAAAFTVDSSGQITAVVPTNAVTGLIGVTTPGGSANSPSTFTVNGTVSNPDLSITATHAGSFTQGDVGDTYTLTVSNVGTANTTGTISVSNALPAGLTATAIGGTGWVPNLGTLTCTRADALAAGAAYPSITVTVNVSASAPASVTNSATVSGGGDTKVANNTANDLTFINPSGGAAPVISSQPQPQTVNVGQNATFTVTATGTAPLAYQWQFNGGAIVGATLGSYTRSNVQLTDSGNYSVTVSNGAGGVISSNALLTVINPGGGGSSNILAQWNFNNISITNNPAPTLGSGTSTLFGGATATYASGATTDTNAPNNAWNTATYPAQSTGNKTRGVQFNVSTLGYQNIGIRWDQKLSPTASKYFRLQYTTNGTDYLDYNVITIVNASSSFEAKTNDLSLLAGVNNNPNFGFRVLSEFESTATGSGTAGYVTTSASGYGAGGTVRYDMMTITGGAIPTATAPAIASQPQSQTAIAGSNVTFSVTATGTAPLSYQWKFNNGGIPGATNSTLVLANVTTNQAGSYSVVVTNGAGSIASSNAVLSVYSTAAATLGSFSYSGTQAQFSVAGVPGYKYAVQTSTNLVDWSSIKTNTSPFTFTDTNLVNMPDRFYRTVYLP
jgi:uncharacterized repeat protein (TIGR01451 family)